MRPIRFTVNGSPVSVEVPANQLLIDLLRNNLQLTGTKQGCSVGVCGACTVLRDGQQISACLTLAVQIDGAEITTIEGLAKEGQLHPLQEAFIAHGAFQCGICTSGQIMSAKALLDSNPNPTRSEIQNWMMGNLCRCTGYYPIIDAIAAAAREMKA